VADLRETITATIFNAGATAVEAEVYTDEIMKSNDVRDALADTLHEKATSLNVTNTRNVKCSLPRKFCQFQDGADRHTAAANAILGRKELNV
jgi:hypothetical protein